MKVAPPCSLAVKSPKILDEPHIVLARYGTIKGLKVTNERQDGGKGVLHKVAQHPIDQVHLYTRRPCPPLPTQGLKRRDTWL